MLDEEDIDAVGEVESELRQRRAHSLRRGALTVAAAGKIALFDGAEGELLEVLEDSS